MEQTAAVALYFDQISPDYRTRYEAKNPFHRYFFRERLKIATQGFSFDCRSILDIGAGTGALYDEIAAKSPTLDYFGCDISSQMLAQSSIPADRAFVGRPQDIHLPRSRFDFIFSLGVTTYQTPEELDETWRFMADHLSDDGVAVVSFTNRASIDNVLRKALKFAKPIARRNVFGQTFGTYAYNSREVEDMARRAGLTATRLTYLNQTFSPFNTLFPRPSVALAKLIEKHAPAAIMPTLSSDFVMIIERI